MHGGEDTPAVRLLAWGRWPAERIVPNGAGSAEPLLSYMRKQLGDDGAAQMVAFLAHIVQFPDVKTGVAVILWGAPATGKSTFARRILPVVLGPVCADVHTIRELRKTCVELREMRVITVDPAHLSSPWSSISRGERGVFNDIETIVSEAWWRGQVAQPMHRAPLHVRVENAVNVIFVTNSENEARHLASALTPPRALVLECKAVDGYNTEEAAALNAYLNDPQNVRAIHDHLSHAFGLRRIPSSVRTTLREFLLCYNRRYATNRVPQMIIARVLEQEETAWCDEVRRLGRQLRLGE